MLGDFFDDLFYYLGIIFRFCLILFCVGYFFVSVYNLAVNIILGPMMVKNEEYELIQESTIELDSFNYSSQETDKTNDVNVQYSYKNEEGNIILKSFVYNEETTKIIEEDIESPYIIIKEYSKKWLSYVDNFSTYELHIPKGSF